MFKAFMVNYRLTQLGETSAAIAETLTEQGIKGTRNEARFCPLYIYLHDKCGMTYVGSVSDMFVGIEVKTGNGFKSVRMPPAAYQFVKEFDRGVWPALDIEAGK